MKQYLIFLVLIFMVVACKNGQKSKIEPVENKEISKKVHPGKLVMEQECNICHSQKGSMVKRIAPPMEAIKRHYIDSNTTKEEFTEALIRWVNDPETESKMPSVHSKFGPMPYIPNPDDAVAQIADYLYDNEIEQPEWFYAHFKKAHQKGAGIGVCNCFLDQEPEQVYAVTGLAYAMEAKAELGRNLQKAIQEKGTIGAIQFCYIEATKLTDSVSMMKNAIIKRVSDKARNLENKANDEELGYISNFKKVLASGEDVKPVVKINNDEVNFYYPIITNMLCLQCHGKPDKQVLPETLATLKSLYPEDKAIGYGDKEVRGIWSINFNTDN